MSFTEDDLAAAANAFAEAPFNHARWIEGLDLFARAGGGWAAQMLGISASAGVAFNWASGLTAEALADFEHSGGAIPGVNPRVIPGFTQPAFSIVADDDFIDAQARIRSDFYQGLFRRYDADFISIARLPGLADVGIIACTVRSARQGHPQGADHEQISRMLPHIAAAMRLQGTVEGQANALRLGAMDALSIPAFLCDALGRVVASSTAGDALLREGTYLRTHLRGLIAAEPACDTMFQRALRIAAFRFPLPDMRSRITSVVLRSVSPSASRIIADVAPLPTDGFALRMGAVAVVALPKTERRNDPKGILRAAYGLTSAEVEVALALCEGLSVAEIASARSGSPQTVRTQLKSIFAKLGVDSQTRIVQAVSNLIGGRDSA